MNLSCEKFWKVFACSIALLLVGTVAFGGPRDEAIDASEYAKAVQPFVERHCLVCHGEKTAKAGFRMDLLGTDFAAPTVAEHWQEVIDRINAGEMPPGDQSRPDATQTAAMVTWVSERLRAVDDAARNAGGQIPMRRLNRDEYANTVRDLLQLDEQIVRPHAGASV